MEEKTITITRNQLIECVAKAVSNVVNDEHSNKGGSLAILMTGAIINDELCKILFDEPEEEQNHDA